MLKMNRNFLTAYAEPKTNFVWAHFAKVRQQEKLHLPNYLPVFNTYIT